MFVSETSLFNSSVIQVKIIGVDGVSVVLEVNPDVMTVDQLKIQAVSHFTDPSECVKTSLYHRLLHVSSSRPLEEEKTLSQSSIKDKDELILLKKRIPAPSLESQSAKARDESKRAPTEEAIAEVTRELPSINHSRHQIDPLGSVDFQAELRKILVSLIDAAQKILCMNPEAVKIFDDAEKYLEEQDRPRSPQVDHDALKRMTDMGFPEDRSKKALLLNRMSAPDAVQWLLEHEDDADVDQKLASEAPASAPNTRVATDTQVTECGCKPRSPRNAGKSSGTEEDAHAGVLNQAQKLSKLPAPAKVKKLLESFRAYRRREFKPNPRALRNLVDMGFEESEAMDSLRIHGNREEEACEWLLSGGNKKADTEVWEEGLDPESSVYKAIMKNPVVQLGLNNPRSLLAFLYMLENPNNTQQWLSDPDTSAMLIQISRIYHAEKHLSRTSSSSLQGHL